MNAKKKMFGDEYLVDFNGKQAAIRAGYSAKTAGQKAYELLNEPEMQEYLKKKKAKKAEKLDLTHERIATEWMKIAFTTIAHMHNTWVTRKEFDELTDDQKDCIESIETKVKKKKKGDTELSSEIEYVKVKLFDKSKALTELGKHIGFYEMDNEQKSSGGVIILPSNGRD